MIKHITVAAATACILLALAVTPAHAQSSGGQLRGHVTFQFVVGGKTLPAGDYVVERIDRRAAQETLLIRSVDGRSSVLVRTSPADVKGRRGEARLIFRCYGESRFLAQLRVGDGDAGLQMPKSRAERALERESRLLTKETPRGDVASDAPRYQTVAILLRRK